MPQQLADMSTITLSSSLQRTAFLIAAFVCQLAVAGYSLPLLLGSITISYAYFRAKSHTIRIACVSAGYGGAGMALGALLDPGATCHGPSGPTLVSFSTAAMLLGCWVGCSHACTPQANTRLLRAIGPLLIHGLMLIGMFSISWIPGEFRFVRPHDGMIFGMSLGSYIGSLAAYQLKRLIPAREIEI